MPPTHRFSSLCTACLNLGLGHPFCGLFKQTVDMCFSGTQCYPNGHVCKQAAILGPEQRFHKETVLFLVEHFTFAPIIMVTRGVLKSVQFHWDLMLQQQRSALSTKPNSLKLISFLDRSLSLWETVDMFYWNKLYIRTFSLFIFELCAFCS